MEFTDKPLQLLRTNTHAKIKKNWSFKESIEFGETYNGLSSVRNKDAFYNHILDLIDESLKKKFGLTRASSKSIGKDSVRRFLDLDYNEGFNIKVKDAFAIYNGFDDYSSFCFGLLENQKKSKNTKLFIIAGGLVIAIFCAFFFKTYFKKEKLLPHFTIQNGKEMNAEEPLVLNYDFGDYNYVKALFEIQGQVNFPKNRKGNTKIILRSPGPKTINLRIDDKVIESQKVFVTSKDWWGSINQTVPLLNKAYIHDGVLQLAANSYDSTKKETYGDFQMHKKFGISADNMIFETRVKNPKKNGFYAYDISINLSGNMNFLTFNMLDPNAKIYNNMTIAQTLFETPDQRVLLDLFGLSLDEWKNVVVKTQNSICTIYLDGKKVFEETYKGKLGDLTSIQFYVKGHGSIDYVKLKSLDGKIVYQDDFVR